MNSIRRIRILKNFHKIIIDRFLTITGLTYKPIVKTIWGGEMQVILPERVSNVIWRDSFFDENVTVYLLKYLKEGDTFIDIGAHFGFYSFLASYLAGKDGLVISFEPTPSTFLQLQFNTERFAPNKNIRICNKAAHSDNNIFEFHDYGVVNSAFNSMKLIGSTKKIKYKKLKVEAVNLDSFLELEYASLKINLIKIDAGSSEYEILKGLENTLNKHSPKIILEVGDLTGDENNNSLRSINYLLEMGYLPYEYEKGNIIKHNILEHYSYNNLIFIKD